MCFVMLTYFRSALPLFVLCFLLKDATSQDGVDNGDFGDIYKAAMDGLSYFNREYKHLDSDAVLGLRVAEGIKEAR